MKKTIAVLPLSILIISILTSCSKTNVSEEVTSSSTEQVEQTAAQNTETKPSQTVAEKISFEATDIDDNIVTDEIFNNYDLTMINVWGTGCVPCIEEMPGLAKFHDGLPTNVNMISVCVDYDADPQFAEDILSQSSANFTTLKVSDSLFESVLTKAQALPTTIFVDREGNIVGDIILGAPDVETDEQVVEHYTNYVYERLGIDNES